MSTTLPHGIIQINEGNISWYGDITANWQLIDSKIGEYDAAVASIPAPANTGTLTINYGGATVAMFGADDAGNVSANIPAAGDGTLTIKVNGATAGTFTANASTNATANIQCVDLTNNQTVGGNKEFTGTTTAHDLVPGAADTYNFGSPSYQWNNAYIKSLTINGVVCGDILTHNVSEFVGVTGDQTIAGVKSFKDVIIRNAGNFTAGEAPTTQTTCMVLKHTNNASTHSANSILSYMFTTGETMCELSQTPCIGSPARTWFRTNTDGSYSIYSYTRNGSLGTPSYKWKSIYSNTYYLGDTAFGNIVTHNASEFVLVSDLTSVLPIGSYIQFAGSQAPTGFLVCNGGEISRTTYSALFDVIGTTYGNGDGSTTFNLPNLTDRFLQGSTTSGTVKNAGLPNITGGFGDLIGGSGDWSGGIGCIKNARWAGNYQAAISGSGSHYADFDFDASRSSSIYGNSTTVQPPALTCLICIKY